MRLGRSKVLDRKAPIIYCPRLANPSVGIKLLPATCSILGRTLMNDSGLISIWRQVIWIV